jgi:cation transport ATPase
MKFIYAIKGMHCKTCIEKIKLALSSYFNVIDVTFHPPRLQIEADNPPSYKILNAILSTAGDYVLQTITQEADASSDVKETEKNGFVSYYPLILIIAYILGVALINNLNWPQINWQGLMSQGMAGFFLVFSAFKLLDLRGFAQGYASYDLLARRWFTYGYLYPFLELGLGLLYLTQHFLIPTQIATVVIMGFSSLGVINSLVKKQKFKCACLGTILNVPLSSITLAEDLTMVILAVLALIMN